MNIDANRQKFELINEMIINSQDSAVTIDNCCGERFIGAGCSDKKITINGIPGNALGAYLDGGTIVVNGNVQDAVGDTLNEGKIIVYGDAGDALGYAMRGGKIFVKGRSGYRTGVHIKEYGDKKPFIIIGKTAGDFLGEYQAGGVIIVLNVNNEKNPVGNYAANGIYGGCIFVRSDKPINIDEAKTHCEKVEPDDETKNLIKEFCETFNYDYHNIIHSTYYKISPNTQNPYKKMYAIN